VNKVAFYSPLRYPGGKGKLAPYISSVIRANGFTDHCYVEPYAGGAGIAIQLLLTGVVPRIIINDIDFHIYAFWHSVLHENERFCQLIEDTPVSLDSWYNQKTIYDHYENNDILTVGFSTFFLNRTNRSGILTGGIIGGKSQKNKYKIDARFNKHCLIERIQAIGKKQYFIDIFNEDALALVRRISKNANNKYIFYFDPPYFKKGYLLYKNSYERQDHLSMARLIKCLSNPWMVTYDRRAEIEEIYEGVSCHEFDIAYSAHLNRPRGLEVMFYSNLELPCAPYARKKPEKQKALGGDKLVTR